MSKEIRKETDIWGNEKEVVYEDGRKVGEIRKEETAFGFGPTVKREYDTSGNLVGETRREETLLGFGPTVERTYGPDGRRVSETRKEETFFGFGPPVERTYSPDGKVTSEARYERTFFGFGPRVKRVDQVRQRGGDRASGQAASTHVGSSARSRSAARSSSNGFVRPLCFVMVSVGGMAGALWVMTQVTAFSLVWWLAAVVLVASIPGVLIGLSVAVIATLIVLGVLLALALLAYIVEYFVKNPW